MALIHQSTNFILESHERPEIDRLEGGHVKISPKISVHDRTELSPTLATELMWYTVLCGEAMKLAMKKSGVDIGRINYQENGNWKPHLHIHLYCRARTATMQHYGKPITPGHNQNYHPLTSEDIANVKEAISDLLKTKKFIQGWAFN
ncbi:HIT domain-containing protein [Candidatus Woesearchaeota archaeon]|nr:HIT domain-containing protein [Candidatus Woesearchaeota archaeon]